MKKEELEFNIKKFVYQLIDDVMPATGIMGKVSNRTAKYWVEQNQWRLDDMLSVFMNRDECIDVQELAKQYEDVLFENGELRLSLKEIVPESFSPILPDKVVLFHKDDLYKLLGLK